MKRTLPSRLMAGAVITAVALVAMLPPARSTFASPSHSPARASHSCLVATGSGDQTFTRNFNPFGSANDVALTQGSIYQPLFIITSAGGGRKYPMLATKYKWSKDAKTLTVTVRHGVKWSDGKPFTAGDVLFTWTAGKINAKYDQIGYTGPTSNIAKIWRSAPDQVSIRFKKRDVTVTAGLLNDHWIIPEHIWSKIKDPSKFTNPNPVGTGPFTKVIKVSGQEYTMGKNPHYWMKGAPYVSCIKRVSAAGNDQAALMMAKGDVDWTGDFIANVQKVYVSRDPAHYHYFYAKNAEPVGLFWDDTKYPWSSKAFRQAVSMAIDRKTMVKIGSYGYAPPSKSIGIEYEFPKWIDSKAEAAGKKYVTYNPSAAKKLLTQSGFTYKGSDLYDKTGARVSMDLQVIAGWTDWVLDMQVLQKELQAIGINATLKLVPTQGTWEATVNKGLAPHFHWTCAGSADPFPYFQQHLSTQNYTPSGADASTKGCNWEHFSDAKADPLIKQWQQTPSVSAQKKLAAKLEMMFVKDFPFVPMFINPIWYTYSTKYFTGFPTQKDYYARGPVWAWPDNDLVLSRVKPVK